MRALLRTVSSVTLAVCLVQAAVAQEAVIRKNLAERMPDLPKIDEVQKTSMPGLWEVRMGVDVLYTDEQGNFLIEGHVIDTKTRANLTQARVDKLTQIDVAALPLKDAIVWKQGSGARKLVVFSDPNCGYCKRLENDFTHVKDVTVYTFLYPILGGDSPEKAKNIWCAKDKTQVWRAWMIDAAVPPRSMGPCDIGALQRNAELGRKHKINGTPAMVFEDGKRVPGAMSTEQIEKQLVASRAK